MDPFASRLKENIGTLAGKTILIVEDDPIFSEGLSTVLQREGCVVLRAANGRDALSRLHLQALPDLILLDMLMPLMDGWSFLAQFKQVPEWSSTPVVIMTALGIATREWAASLGATDVIRKPAEIDELVEALRRQC